MITVSPDIPRWAEPLGEKTWQRINELLGAGWATMDIVRKLKIPDEKLRSLQHYARTFGPRRRLTQFAAFKDSLLSGAESFGGDIVAALGMIGQLAVSPETKPAIQVRAFEAMASFTNSLTKMLAEDAKAKREHDLRDEVDNEIREELSDDAIRKIRDIYGIDADGGD